MKQYKNKKTGVIVSVNSEIGGDWELIKAPAAKTEKPVEEKPKKEGKQEGRGGIVYEGLRKRRRCNYTLASDDI